jgi:hypothetical protein
MMDLIFRITRVSVKDTHGIKITLLNCIGTNIYFNTDRGEHISIGLFIGFIEIAVQLSIWRLGWLKTS